MNLIEARAFAMCAKDGEFDWVVCQIGHFWRAVRVLKAELANSNPTYYDMVALPLQERLRDLREQLDKVLDLDPEVK